MLLRLFAVFVDPVLQVLLHQLLVFWGPTGFEAFLKRLQRKYAQQAVAAAAAAEQHLSDLAEWQPVTAGMFQWMRLKGEPYAGRQKA